MALTPPYIKITIGKTGQFMSPHHSGLQAMVIHTCSLATWGFRSIHQWSRYWFFTWPVPNHLLNRCMICVGWTLVGKIQQRLTRISNLSLRKAEICWSSVRWGPFCLGLNVFKLQWDRHAVLSFVCRTGGVSFCCEELCEGVSSRWTHSEWSRRMNKYLVGIFYWECAYYIGNFCYILCSILGCICSTNPFKYRWSKWYIGNTFHYHHQILSIILSHCHIFPKLRV